MLTVVADHAELSRAVRAEADRVAGLLRAGGDPGAAAPGLHWTALQVARHLAVALRGFGLAMSGGVGPMELPAHVPGQTMPEFLAAANEVTLGLVPSRSLAEAADALVAGADGVLEALARDGDPDRACGTPWYGPGATRTASTLAALAVTELLVHGYDIAGALGGRREMPVRSARAATATVMTQMLPLLVDPAVPEDLTVRYGVRVRGAGAFTLELARGQVRVAPPASSDDVDCTISVTAPVALLLGFRRVSLRRAMLHGGALATGRRPWLGLQFPSLFLSA